MMVVVVLSKCTESLRGDLAKWLIEVDAMVFVGKVTSRIKDKLWDRIQFSIGAGRAIMIFEADNEQRFDMYGCNTVWKRVDYDGLILVAKPLPKGRSESNSL